MSDPTRRSLPLTDLSEDETMFREQVRSFAEKEVRPLVAQMDKDAQIPRTIVNKCFDLGIMGVEIPEQYGGAGATFFMSTLVVEELARVDASVAVLVDVQNTLVNNALLRWGTEEQRAKYFPKLATKWVGPMRSPRPGPARTRSRSPAARPTGATTTS
jgi:alkylation response protein AidB-like acyl-CoA dehydrogenase